MSTARQTVSSASGIFALFVMLVVCVCAYTTYLVETHKALDYQADALVPAWHMLQPVSVMKIISEGGWFGTLVAVLLRMGHALLYSAVVFSLGTILFARYFKPRNIKNAPKDEEERPGIYACAIEGSTLMVSIPGVENQTTGKKIQGVFDTNPFDQVYLRCDRKQVQTKRATVNAIENLEVAMYELLAAHPDVPASVGHHHADTNLKDHSLSIAKAVLGYYSDRQWNESLAKVAGLAHDMDKLLAYQEKEPGVWVKRKDATHHNTFSAYLVAQQPEFKLLDADDQHTLTMALRYYHHPDRVPKTTTERTTRLIQALRNADMGVIQAEKAEGILSAREASMTSEIVDKAIEQMLLAANINDILGNGTPGGWTKDALDIVVVPMSRIIETIGEFMPGDLARQLQLNVASRNFSHPSISIFIESLQRQNLLVSTYKDKQTPTGQFDVKIAIRIWKACVLLDKEQVEKMMPTAVAKWGSSNYNIRVVRPTLPMSQDDDENADK